jgi:hypothetical protein
LRRTMPRLRCRPSLRGRRQVARGEIPVGELLEEGRHVVGPPVLIVEVIGVLPHVDGEQRDLAVDDRRVGIAGRADLELVVGEAKPGPAAAELADRRCLEGGGEGGEAAQILLDPISDSPARRATLGQHGMPEKIMVPGLGRIVEQGRLVLLAGGSPDDRLQALVGELGVGDQLVGLVDIGLVMLAVVDLQGGLADMGNKRVISVGKLRQLDGHDAVSRNLLRSIGGGARTAVPG